MYNGVKNQTDLERGMSKGGIQTPRGFRVIGQDPREFQVIKTEPKQVRVYKPPHGQGMGPIFSKPISYTMYDLLTNPDDADLRYQSFEDWVFPEIKTMEDGSLRMGIQRIVRRGSERGNGVDAMITNSSVTQYVYVLLNPSKNPVQSFGEFDGMTIRRSDYLVCVEVGNPATGRLDEAFIQYVIKLQDIVRDRVSLSTTLPEVGGYRYLYSIAGDHMLEKEIFNRWFNSGDYYFNSVIYPKVRAFMT